MRKLLTAVLYLLCIALILCSCTSNDPGVVARGYLEGAFAMDFDKMDENSIVPCETIFMAQIKGYIEKNKMTEKEIWEMLAENLELEKPPRNFDEYKKYYRIMFQKEFKERYGDDFNYTVSVVSIQDESEDDIKSILEEVSDHYDSYGIIISDIIDFSKVKECKKITCKIYKSGKKVKEDDSVETESVYVVKQKSKWKVLNLGLSNK